MERSWLVDHGGNEKGIALRAMIRMDFYTGTKIRPIDIRL